MRVARPATGASRAMKAAITSILVVIAIGAMALLSIAARRLTERLDRVQRERWPFDGGDVDGGGA